MNEALEPGIVVVRGNAKGFAQEIAVGRHGSRTLRSPTRGARSLNVYDHRAVCAKESLAAARGDGASRAFEDSRRGLRRLRDDGGNAGPDPGADRVGRRTIGGAAREAARDRTQVPSPPDADLGDQ